MPSETGAFLILIALVPGWWFIRRREQVTGDQRASNLDELLQVLVAGIATTGVPLATLLLLPAERPGWIVDVKQWLSTGDPYLRDNLPSFVFTSAAMLVIAISIAHVAAKIWPAPRRRLNDRSSMWVNTIGHNDNPGHKYISAELQDGRVFEGYLFGITPDGPLDEQVLTLEEPIFIKPEPSVEEGQPYPVGRVALPLSQVRYVSVLTIPHAPTKSAILNLNWSRVLLGHHVQATLKVQGSHSHPEHNPWPK